MLGKNVMQVRLAMLAMFTIITSFWLFSDVEPGPGTPLRMYNQEGTDLNVAALTYSHGPDHRWHRLTEPTLRIIPGRLLLELHTFEMGSGQDIARQAGINAASYVLGKDGLEDPVGVYPGVVSGTSSGLAWAIATIIMSDPTLNDGGAVYATGSLHSTERVGSINGLSEKLNTPGLSDARAIFVPAEQFKEAIAALHKHGDRKTANLVVGVASVSEALAYLCESRSKSPSCTQKPSK